MQKIVIVLMVIILGVLINLYSYYLGSENEKEANYINSIKYSYSILIILDKSKSNTKQILNGDINRLFIEINNSNNIEKYKILCDEIDLSKLKKNDNILLINGKKKFKNLCE